MTIPSLKQGSENSRIFDLNDQNALQLVLVLCDRFLCLLLTSHRSVILSLSIAD